MIATDVLLERTRSSLMTARLLQDRVQSGSPEGLDIQVSVGTLERALRIYAQLLRMLPLRGHTAEIGADGTCVIIDEEPVPIRIAEEQRQENRRGVPRGVRARVDWFLISGRFGFKTTGKLLLQIRMDGFGKVPGVRTQWRDGELQRLEDCLDDFVSGVEAAAEARREIRRHREASNAEYRLRAQLADEERRAAQETAANIEALKQQIDRLRSAREIRSYVADLEHAAEQRGGVVPGSDLAGWLQWAQSYADSIDPLESVLRLNRGG